MKGSEFVQYFGPKGLPAWEAAAFDLVREGSSVVNWPMVPVHLESPGHTAVVNVAADVFAVGEPGDFVRLPLTPNIAQRIANLSGYLLPTPKLACEIARQADVKLTPQPQQNKGGVLGEYLKHDQTIELQRAGRTGLVTGHKKDVIISNLAKAGKVLIYGWFWPPGVTPPAGFSNPIQARSNVHGDFYVDYSHGIRFVAPYMSVDGQERLTEEVLRDPELSKLLSDEGPLRVIRYPAPNDPKGLTVAEYKALASAKSTASFADVGLAVLTSKGARL
jgi:hypothetical protein